MQPHRDIDITWRPISLFFKNEPDPDSPWFEKARFTHGLLRVMESVRTTNGNEGVFKLHWEFGSRIHHDKESPFGPIISRIPSTEKSIAMWDALVTMMDVDSFFELKRTRTEGPQPGDRPLPR